MLPSATALKGNEELIQFASTTFRHLVLEEESLLKQKGNSDLRVFCRLDISVIRDEKGDLHYFSNEISNTLRCNLFLAFLDEARNVMASDIAVALRTWVAMRRSRKEISDVNEEA